jgi:ABC-type proline/glycine betaine transport system permease subunit
LDAVGDSVLLLTTVADVVGIDGLGFVDFVGLDAVGDSVLVVTTVADVVGIDGLGFVDFVGFDALCVNEGVVTIVDVIDTERHSDIVRDIHDVTLNV